MTMNRWKYMNINLMDDDRGMPVLKQNLKHLRPSFLFPEPEPPTSGESATPLFLSLSFFCFLQGSVFRIRIRVRLQNGYIPDPEQGPTRFFYSQV